MTIFGKQEFSVGTLRKQEYLLLKHHPCVRRELVGHSLLGREINAFQIGEGGPVFAAVFHAAERFTGAALMRYLFDKAREWERGAFSKGFCAIPMVNPDGVQIALFGPRAAGRFAGAVGRKTGGDTRKWQANARGVDLNHNFNAESAAVRENEILGGYVVPGRTRYGGGEPESEPESRTLAEFCRRRDFSAAAALHSQGREIFCSPGAFADAKRLSALSGYRVSEPEAIAVGGGFKDWFSERFEKPAFTLELGIGDNPLPPSAADREYPRLKRMLDLLTEQGG